MVKQKVLDIGIGSWIWWWFMMCHHDIIHDITLISCRDVFVDYIYICSCWWRPITVIHWSSRGHVKSTMISGSRKINGHMVQGLGIHYLFQSMISVLGISDWCTTFTTTKFDITFDKDTHLHSSFKLDKHHWFLVNDMSKVICHHN